MPNNVNDGTLSILEQVDILFKRDKNKVSVDVTRPFYQETLNIRPAVLFSQIWSDQVPTVSPNDLLTLTETSKDSNGINNMKGSTTGYISTHNSNIRRFIKVQLLHVPGANDLAYYLPNIFQDVIPFNHDPNGTYQVRVYKQDTEAEIPFGETGGEWIINHESSVITFFEINSVTGVDKDNPPLVSFYRYEGSKGTIPSDTVTSTTVFNGGDGSCGDGASAIFIDTERGSLGQLLGEGECSYAIQWGPDPPECGSWRIIPMGNGDGTTSLHFQYRNKTINSWQSKFHLDPSDCADDCTDI